MFYTSKEDSERALADSLQKELSYLPEAGYMDHLLSSGLIIFRLGAIQWLIKTQSMLNLSFRALFDVANYLDRFLFLNQCFVWKYWMIELLSVASKYSDVSTPLLNGIQFLAMLTEDGGSGAFIRVEHDLMDGINITTSTWVVPRFHDSLFLC